MQPGHRAGFVALVGRPNVGKSTLVNALLGQVVAAVSPRPQTTRRRQLGILTLPQAQIVWIDTPGIHKPHHKLGAFMNEEALETLSDADLLLFMVDASGDPTLEDELVAERLASLEDADVILVLNKADLVPLAERAAVLARYHALLPAAEPRWLSAANGEGRDELLAAVIARLPESPPFYDTEQITDLYEREIAADLVRAAALDLLYDEVPHAIAVRVDEYKERADQGAFIAATLLVEKDSHKGIVIGKEGAMLKQIGIQARQAIEAMNGRKVFLELRVKVNKNWRNDPAALERLGFTRPSGEG
ncbi:MAG: GTPase Era [Anaerolineae bacterium]|nr:GTPase Era [Anaerolineae bacterium]